MKLSELYLILFVLICIVGGGVLGYFIVEAEDAQHRREIIELEEKIDAARAEYLRDSLDRVAEQEAAGLITPRGAAVRIEQLKNQEKMFRGLRLAEQRIRFMRIAGCTDDAEMLVKRGLIRPGDVESFAELNYCAK